jgi:hypothetical protein
MAAPISLSLADLFADAFGYRTPAFEPQFDKLPARKERSDTGAAYWSIDQATGREYYMPVTLGDQELPFPVISIRSRKMIVETPMVEQRGTVKELISSEDYEITIRGLIISKEREYPEAKVKMLRDLYERNEALTIICPITDIFLATPDRGGYDSVVIKSISFPEVRGKMTVRAYELELVSDSILNLIEL